METYIIYEKLLVLRVKSSHVLSKYEETILLLKEKVSPNVNVSSQSKFKLNQKVYKNTGKFFNQIQSFCRKLKTFNKT